MNINSLIRNTYEIIKPCTDLASIKNLLIINSFLVVIDDKKKFVGILTISDIIKSNNQSFLVSDCISEKPTVDEKDEIERVFQVMTESNNTVLAVLKNKKLTGIITLADITAYLFQNKKQFETDIENKKLSVLSLEKSISSLEKRVEKKMNDLSNANEKMKKKLSKKSDGKNEQNYFEIIIERIKEGIIITDSKQNIQYVNSGFEKLSGYDRKEVIGKQPFFIKSDKNYQKSINALIVSIKENEAWSGQLINQHKDGNSFTIESNIYINRNESGDITNFLFINRDISNEIKIEEKLRQSQRMEAIRTLAGGIAHDFNNILFPIIGYTEMTIDDVPEGSLSQNNLKEVLIAANRAKILVQMILSLSRQAEQEKTLIKVEIIVKEALKFLRSSLPSTIEIKSEIDREYGQVMADPVQIHQLFISICKIAYETLKENGGILNVSFSNIDIIPDNPLKNELEPCKYIKLTINYTDKNLIEEIKEHFFNKNNIPKGLDEKNEDSLTASCEIVQNHNGCISVSRNLIKGTAFNIYLPQICSDTIVSGDFNAEDAPKGCEHILIIDDEKPIVNLMTQMLERLNYKITPRSDSIDALNTFYANPKDFDLIITDQTMPNLTGLDLAKKVLDVRQNIPIILYSGFSELVTKEKIEAIGITEYLTKPIVMSELAKVIRQILDKDNLHSLNSEPFYNR